MNLGVSRGSVVAVMSVLLSLLLLIPPTHQQYAWRPQGRFGKRVVDYQLSADSEGLLSSGTDGLQEGLRNLDSLQNQIRMIDLPMFELGRVLCISSGSKGLYRCFKYLEPVDAAEDLDKH